MINNSQKLFLETACNSWRVIFFISEPEFKFRGGPVLESFRLDQMLLSNPLKHDFSLKSAIKTREVKSDVFFVIG